MQPLTNKTLKLFFGSGAVLFLLCFAGVFMLAWASVSHPGNAFWSYFFFLLVAGTSSIALYYLLIAFFGWVLLQKKGQKVRLF